MKFEYDKKADAAYIYLRYPIEDKECKRTVELNENIILDFDKSNKLIGVEILNASKILSKETIEEAIPA